MMNQFSRSVMSNSLQPHWTTASQASLSITNSQSLLTLMSIESVMPSNHLILCRPLLLLPSVIPSIRVFSNESVLYSRWPKYWSFSFSISPSNEYSGLISFRMDCLDLLAVHESGPDTNRRLWTPRFPREALRAILHLELLLALARGQTPMETTVQMCINKGGVPMGTCSRSGYPFPRGTLLSAWHLILKGDQSTHFLRSSWGVFAVGVAQLIITTQYRRLTLEDIIHLKSSMKKRDSLFSTYSKNVSGCFSKSLKCGSVCVCVCVCVCEREREREREKYLRK